MPESSRGERTLRGRDVGLVRGLSVVCGTWRSATRCWSRLLAAARAAPAARPRRPSRPAGSAARPARRAPRSPTSSSSRRVPDWPRSTAGKSRLSARSLRSRSSMFSVPVNSSKISSSIAEPLSTSAVARMVSEPPSSRLRAAPKNRLGGYSAAGVDPAGQGAPAGRGGEVVRAAEPGQPVEQHDHVVAELDQPLGPLDRELGDRRVVGRRPVERRGDHLALDRALEVGDLLGPLVDQHHHQVALGVVGGDRVRRSTAGSWSCRRWPARRSGRAGPCRSARRGRCTRPMRLSGPGLEAQPLGAGGPASAW